VLADQANTGQLAAFAAVSGAVADHAATIQAATFATKHVAGTFEANLARVEQASTLAQPLRVEFDAVNAESDFLPEGFSYSAPTMLVLFVFINAVASGAAIIQTRKLGIYERMLAGPVTTRSIVAGETVVYLSLAIFQSAVIVAIGLFLFNVDWGDPVGAFALVAMWALVGTGAGMLSGTLFRTPEQAFSIGPPVGIALGMLGGCMWPLEIVPRALQIVGHVVPHGWAVDAWTELLSRGGGVLDIGTELLVLAAFAAALLAAAVTRLRLSLVP
jgi:ABC-2 type transport system permease protein